MKEDRIGNWQSNGKFNFREISKDDAELFEALELAAPKVYVDPFKTGREHFYAEPKELRLFHQAGEAQQ